MRFMSSAGKSHPPRTDNLPGYFKDLKGRRLVRAICSFIATEQQVLPLRLELPTGTISRIDIHFEI